METLRKNRNEMYHLANYDKNGNLISFRIKCSIKNPKTNKFEQKSKTWKVPEYLKGKKEIMKALREEKDKFKKEQEEILNGKRAQCGVGFIDYAKEWLKELERTKSKSYCHRAIDAINLFEQEFQKITFDKLTPDMVKAFYNKLQNKDISKPKIYLKKSLWDEIIKQYKTKNIFCSQFNISRTTLLEAENGKPLNEKSVNIICEALHIKKNDYFTFIDFKERHYKRESILKYKRIMSTIFNNAVRDRVLEDNYTSTKYIKLVFPEDEEADELDEDKVLSKEESIYFLDCLDKVSDIRWKIYFGLILVTGLRSCEMNGLRWQDIDFEKKTMKIERDRLYNSTYGVYVCKTKNKTSKREIPLSQTALNYLIEYKKWYDNYVSERPGLYDEDYLMISLEGGNMHPCTPKGWLDKFRKQFNIKKTTIHYLRHTFISLCLVANIPIITVSKWVGHANSNITLKTYAHYIKQSGFESVNKVDSLFIA